MAQPLIASMPKDLDLGGGFILRITAVSPTTGAAVSGVKVSNLVMTVNPLTPTTGLPGAEPGGPAPSPLLVPLSTSGA